MAIRDLINTLQEKSAPLRARLENELAKRRPPRKPEPRYALAGTAGTYRVYEANIIGTVLVDGLELPLADERGEIDMAKSYQGQTYKYSGKGTRIKGYSAVLPDMVWPYYEEGRDVLLVEYGDSYVIFTT
jgi:hypothetical protein